MDESPKISRTEIEFYLKEKKKNNFQSPDISKMQMVEIDGKTKIYIAMDASAEEARRRYKEHQAGKRRF